MADNIFSVLLVFSLWTVAHSQCPNGFMVSGNSCYMDFNMQATWAEASIICQAYGGHLADINSEHEQHYLSSYIQSKTQNAYKPGIFWLGASEWAQEWFWTEGHTTMTYKNFAPGEPNNADNDEHCLEFDFGYNFQWNDNRCENKFNFICEVSAISGGGLIG